MRPTRLLLALCLGATLWACTSEETPATTSTTTTIDTPVPSTTVPDGTTTSTSLPPILPPPAGLPGVKDNLVALLPGGWPAPTLSRAPFSVNVCGRTVRVVDADPTDESPNRPQEGFILTTTAPGDSPVSVVVFEQFNPDTMEKIASELHHCGPTTLTNPTDGWTLRSEFKAAETAAADIPGILVSTSSSRTYTDNRATRFSASQLFFGENNGFLIRLTVSTSSHATPALLEDLLEDVARMVATATGG